MRTPHDFISALVDRYGLRQADLTALAPKNDPFLTGRPADIEKAEWFARTYEALGQPEGLHLREIHYQIIARGLPLPDGTPYTGNRRKLHPDGSRGEDQDWPLLLEASSRARELGLVSPFTFFDGRTQRQDENDELRATTKPGYLTPPESLENLVLPDFDFLGWQLPSAPTPAVPEALSLQPVVVELWAEKASPTIDVEVRPVAEEYGVRVVVGIGFQSEVAAADLVQRAIRDGRPRIVLWLADADKKGEQMAVATARHTEFLCRWWLKQHEPKTVVPKIVMDRLALTLEQVAEIEDDRDIEIPRSPDAYRDEGRVELQALPAFAPGWIAEEFRRRVDEITVDLDDEIETWEQEQTEALEEQWEVATSGLTTKLDVLNDKRDEVLDGFDIVSLQNALHRLEPDREALVSEYEAFVEGFRATMDSFPESELDLNEEGRDWMLDTEREYDEQLNAYRRHEALDEKRGQGNREPLDFVERQCECGGSLAGKRANARRCDDCRKRRPDRRK